VAPGTVVIVGIGVACLAGLRSSWSP